MSVFKTQSLLTIRLDTLTDLSSATTKKILYKKPSGATGEWTATADSQTLVYEVQAGDIDEAGTWEFQSSIVVGGRTGLGTIVSQKFNNPIVVT